MYLALNNLQRLICHETQTTKQPTNQSLRPITKKKFKSWTRLIAFHIALIPLGKV